MPEITYTVSIDPDDPMLEPLEIGKGKDLLLGTTGQSPQMIFVNIENGKSWWRYEPIGATEAAIRFRSWQTPTPNPLPPISNWQPSSRQVEDAVLLLGALVRMMGGSVTVSPGDLREAQGGALTNYVMQDPHSIVLVYEEKS